MSTPAATDIVTGAQYNYGASRLLLSSGKAVITVHDLLPNKKLDRSDKISFGQGYKPTSYPCFAGKEDELIFYSSNNQLLGWQLPSTAGRSHLTVDSPLLQLDGHQNQIIDSLCFNKNIEALASGDNDGIIKLWVPNETS